MLSAENTLVLVVDIQERLLPALHNGELFIAKSVQFLTGANALQLPIVVTEQYPKGLGATLSEIASLTENAPVLAKTRFSAWIDEVQTIVRERNVQNIVLIGCETHICLLQTVLDIQAAGLQSYVVQECVTSRTAANVANGLQQMRDAGAIVSNVESVLFQCLQDAKHAAFKQISKLIQ